MVAMVSGVAQAMLNPVSAGQLGRFLSEVLAKTDLGEQAFGHRSIHVGQSAGCRSDSQGRRKCLPASCLDGQGECGRPYRGCGRHGHILAVGPLPQFLARAPAVITLAGKP